MFISPLIRDRTFVAKSCMEGSESVEIVDREFTIEAVSSSASSEKAEKKGQEFYTPAPDEFLYFYPFR